MAENENLPKGNINYSVDDINKAIGNALKGINLSIADNKIVGTDSGGIDLNSYKDIGTYSVSGVSYITNCPSSYKGIMVVGNPFGTGRKSRYQEYTSYLGTKYYRYWDGEDTSSWTEWSKTFVSGSQIAIPITNGGTGLTSSPSMIVKLNSTSADNVLQGSPRPGIMGTLAIDHGGTGLTSSPSMLVNLQSSESDNIFKASPQPGVTGILSIQNGGTGYEEIKRADAIIEYKNNYIASSNNTYQNCEDDQYNTYCTKGQTPIKYYLIEDRFVLANMVQGETEDEVDQKWGDNNNNQRPTFKSSGITYYSLNSANNTYSEVTSPVPEDFNTYFIFLTDGVPKYIKGKNLHDLTRTYKIVWSNDIKYIPRNAVLRKSNNSSKIVYTQTQQGALYAKGTNGYQYFGILPVECGGTGSNMIYSDYINGTTLDTTKLSIPSDLDNNNNERRTIVLDTSSFRIYPWLKLAHLNLVGTVTYKSNSSLTLSIPMLKISNMPIKGSYTALSCVITDSTNSNEFQTGCAWAQENNSNDVTIRLRNGDSWANNTSYVFRINGVIALV